MTKRILRRTLLGGVMVATLAPPIGAEENDDAPGAGSAGTRIEESLLVTASLEPESADLLPVAASVIGRREIEDRQAHHVADLLRSVAGLDVVRSGTTGKVTSLFTRGTESDHTLVLWNGIELNSPYFGGFDWGLLPTDGVERVEVVRGPYSALYGSDAVGGVVQVLSGPSRERLTVEAGENGHSRMMLTAGVEGERLAIDVAAHRRRGDGEATNDFYDSDDASVRLRWEPTEALEVGLVGRYNESEVGIPFSGGLPTPRRRSAWDEHEISVPIEYSSSRWRVAGRLSRVEQDSAFFAPDDPFGFTFADNRSTSERARVVVTRHAGDDTWIAFGSEVERQEVDSGSVFGPDLEGERQRTDAWFGQLFHSAGRWRIDLGVRADDHDAFGSATTPRLGVAFAATARHRFHLAAAEGFRAPSLGELYFPFSGNPALEPERTESVELGWSYRGSRVDVAVTAFENELEELIDFDFATFTNINVGRARTRGVETTAGFRRRTVEGRLTATRLDTENLEDRLDLLRRPEWRGSLVVTWRPEDWAVTATAFHTGSRPDVDPATFERATNPGYERLDVAVAYRGWSRWSPYARVENLTEETYSEALGFPAPGRTMVAGVRLDFQRLKNPG